MNVSGTGSTQVSKDIPTDLPPNEQGATGGFEMAKPSQEIPETVLVKIGRLVNYKADNFAPSQEPCARSMIASYQGVPFYQECQINPENGDHQHSSFIIRPYPAGQHGIPAGSDSVVESAINLSFEPYASDPDAKPKLEPTAEQFTINYTTTYVQASPEPSPSFDNHLVETPSANIYLTCKVKEQNGIYFKAYHSHQVKNISKENGLIPADATQVIQEKSLLSAADMTALQAQVEEVKLKTKAAEIVNQAVSQAIAQLTLESPVAAEEEQAEASAPAIVFAPPKSSQ